MVVVVVDRGGGVVFGDTTLPVVLLLFKLSRGVVVVVVGTATFAVRDDDSVTSPLTLGLLFEVTPTTSSGDGMSTGAGISSVFRTDDMAGDGDVIIGFVELAVATGGLTTTGDGDLTLLLLLFIDIVLGDADMIVGEGDLTVADVVDDVDPPTPPPTGLSLKIFAS